MARRSIGDRAGRKSSRRRSHRGSLSARGTRSMDDRDESKKILPSLPFSLFQQSSYRSSAFDEPIVTVRRADRHAYEKPPLPPLLPVSKKRPIDRRRSTGDRDRRRKVPLEATYRTRPMGDIERISLFREAKSLRAERRNTGNHLLGPRFVSTTPFTWMAGERKR
jgi:hypothetical protein